MSKKRRQRRHPWFLWLACAGPVRVLRLRPGDTLVVSVPPDINQKNAADLCRRLEEAVGLANDVEVIALSDEVRLTTLRQGGSL